MDTVLLELAKQYPSAAFIRVEAEEVDAVTEKCGVTTVPYFLFYKGTQVVDKLEGADAASLTQKTTNLVSTPAAAPAPPSAAVAAPVQQDITSRIKALLEGTPLLLFMKGTVAQPYCGFSSKVVDVLKQLGYPFKGMDILQDQELRAGVKEYSNWPTYPQLYLNGELVGGCDIIMEMAQSGELKQMLQDKLGAPPAKPPAAAAGAGAGGVAGAAAAGSGGAGGAAAAANGGGLVPELRSRLEALVNEKPVMLFMKGSPEAPRCGFSRKVAEALNKNGLQYGSFDILSDEAVRQGLKELSHWPTYPQVYVKGELLGGCDIVLEMEAAGELKTNVEEMMHRMADPE